jgi:hypothetical protein
MADKLARCIFDLLRLTAMQKERMHRRHWIEIPDTTWRIWFGGDASKVKRFARELGLMESNRSYSSMGTETRDAFGIGYRITAGYHGSNLEEYVLRRKPRGSSSDKARYRNLDEVGLWLAGMLPLFDLDLEISDLKCVWEVIQATVIRAADHYAVRCEYGRFHSQFTSISRDLRKRLMIRHSHDGALAMTDVRNSQPLTLGLLASMEGVDCHKWIDLCSRGMLYEVIAKESGCSRTQAKADFLPMVFDRVKAMQRYSSFGYLKRAFPEIVDFMIETKKGDYRLLAQRCQKLESRIFIDGACGSLMEVGFEIPMLTVHDAVITTREGIEVVERAIRAKYREHKTEASLKKSLVREE